MVFSPGLFPSYLVAPRRRFRADRRPCTKLTGHNHAAAICQLGARSSVAALEVVVFAALNQAGRSKRIDRRGDWHYYARRLRILLIGSIDRFLRYARSRQQV